ncbi:MAG: FAD-dependent oxidoreductase [Patescibacteria group bacterium]
MPKSPAYDYVIIGGGIAGTTAAETIRTRDTQGTIAIVSLETDHLYSRVLLPAYIRGKIPREKVFLRSLEDYAKHNIDFFGGLSVVGFEAEKREVHTSDGAIISGAKILIATGGTPRFVPFAAGIEDYTFRLQTLTDADRFRAFVDGDTQSKEKNAVVVGGGFIGLEFVETAFTRGYKPHLLLREKQCFGNQLDLQGWEVIAANFGRHGVAVYPETEIQRTEFTEKGFTVTATGGVQIPTAWIGYGIGVERNLLSFQGTGIRTNRGIVVNEFLESSMGGVWAAGDVAEYRDTRFGEDRLVGNWNNAFLQGKTAGLNMTAHISTDRTTFHAVPTYSITSLGLQLTFTGITEPRDGWETISRVWDDGMSYERLFIGSGVLKGAILINRFQDKMVLSKLIESQQNISAKKEALYDPQTSLSSIFPA